MIQQIIQQVCHYGHQIQNMNSFILERDHTSIKKLNVIFNEILQISFSKNDYFYPRVYD